jgi:endo-1,4-beta-xylanase
MMKMHSKFVASFACAVLALGCGAQDAEQELTGSLQQAVSTPPVSSCGYSLTNGTYTTWPGGYQAWVELKNAAGPVATTFEVLMDLGGTTLQNGYQATYTPQDGGVRATAPSWLKDQKIPVGSSYRFAFVGGGTYTSVKPYLLSINGTKCDTTAPVIALSASTGFVTSPTTLTLTVTASDDVAVWKVVFKEDGVVIGEDRTAPYTLTRPLTTGSNGRRRYTATAVDPSGNPATANASVLVSIGNRFLGGATDNAGDYVHFADHFDQLTPGNAGKWGTVEPVRDEMNWEALDQAFQFAQTHQIPFKLHTLVWGQQQPSWLAALPAAEQLAELDEFMAELAGRYGDVAMVDVVNEPLHAPPSYAAALGGAGTTGWDWVIKAFEMARVHFPRSELILNDYQILILDPFTDQYLQIIDLLKARGLIDGIGEQGHFLERAELPVVAANLGRLAATGLPIYITELDVNFASDARHANVLRDLVTTFWANPSVVGITHWGHEQGSTWQANAYLIRTDGSLRPGLAWLDCARAGGTNCTVPEYVPAPRTGGEFGITLEAEDYDAAQGLIAAGSTVAYTDDGDWLSFDSVVLAPEWDTLTVTYMKGNEAPGGVSVHLDSLSNEPVAVVDLLPTGGWGTASTIELPWVSTSGSHDVFVRFNGTFGVANLDSIAIGREPPSDGYGPNLIANGDFESGTSGWFGWGGTITASSELAHGGAQSLKVSNRSAGQGTAAYDLTSAVEAGKSYALRFYVSIAGAATAPVNITRKVSCAGQGDSYSWVGSDAAVSEGGWTELGGVLEVPTCELTNLLVYVEGPPAGVDLYVDDASVRAPLTQNLVANGAFESNASGWFGWGGTLTASSERAHGGAQSLKVSNRSAGQGTAAYDLTSVVSAGTTYQTRFFVTIGGAASAPVNITRKFSCAGESDSYAWVSNSADVVDGVWTELSGALAVPNCELTNVLIYVEGPPAGVDLYVDDVVVSP